MFRLGRLCGGCGIFWEAVAFVGLLRFFLFWASFCNTFQVSSRQSQSALCKCMETKNSVLCFLMLWATGAVFEIRKTSPGQCFALHVKSGLDAKQLSIIWQSLQVETVTEGAAEFQLVANLSAKLAILRHC